MATAAPADGTPRLSLRTAPMFLCGALATLAAGVLAVAMRVLHAGAVVDPVMRWWAGAWLWPAGARISVSGLEHICSDGPYVVVANHESSLDSMVCLRALPLSLRFLAKRELFHIPVLDAAMRSVGMIPVDRRAPDLARIDAAAADCLSSGHSLVVFPEGGVAAYGGLRPFKDGAFVIAVANAAQILPVTVVGTRAIWRPGHPAIHAGRVRVVVGQPISTRGMNSTDVAGLRDGVRALINTSYDAAT